MKLGGRRRKFVRDANGNVVRKNGKPVQSDKAGNVSEKTRAAAMRVVRERAESRAANLAPTIRALQAAGKTTLRTIAAALNERGIPRARGAGKWSAAQVMRVLERLE